jgi:hypothetical protein
VERGETPRPLRPWGQTEEQAYFSALDAYMDADSEDDEAFEAARSKLKRALMRYARAVLSAEGWRAPKSEAKRERRATCP